MRFLALSASLLLAGSAVAAPGTARRRARAADVLNGRTPSVNQRVGTLEGINSITNKTNVEYSGNWAGGVLVSTGITQVSGVFTAPKPTSAGSGSAWVGIDGDTCQTAILQTGIDWTYSGGDVSYDVWYEWYPDYAYNFSPSLISISAGDEVSVKVVASSTTGGTAYVTNETTGKSVSHTFSNEASEGSLCETNAEWIVEDFESDGSLVSFADFGTVTFKDTSATTKSGVVSAAGASVIDIEQNGKVLTDCSVGSSVTCTYV